MFVDKKTTNCQLNIVLELDRLLRDLDHTLNKALHISSFGVPFHLKNWATSNNFGGLDILRCYITTRVTSCEYLPKVQCGGKYHIFILNRSFAWTAPAICCLQNNFMLSFAVSTKPNSPIFFGLHTCNPQGCILKIKSCKPNVLWWTTKVLSTLLSYVTL